MTTTRLEKYKIFRALHERPGVFVIPNPWDAGSAKILTALGFEALATTSAGCAFSKGHLDSVPEMTRDVILQNAKRNCGRDPSPCFRGSSKRFRS